MKLIEATKRRVPRCSVCGLRQLEAVEVTATAPNGIEVLVHLCPGCVRRAWLLVNRKANREKRLKRDAKREADRAYMAMQPKPTVWYPTVG